MVHHASYMHVFVMFFMIGCSSQETDYQHDTFSLDWEIVAGNHEGTNETLSLLTIHNHSADTLLATGWTIYFNAGVVRVAESDTSMAKIEMLNGDFFSLYPQAGWQPLLPDSSVQIRILSRVLRNFTDVPKGFYLVSAKYPDGITLPFALTPSPQADSTERAIAEKVFVQNEQITDVSLADLPPIFPTPLTYERTASSFELDAGTTIVADADFEKEAAYLQQALSNVLTESPRISNQADGKVISLRKKALAAAEGYELTIDSERVLIEASTAAGVFYGIQSLKNLLPPQSWKAKQTAITLEGVAITDAPRFGHRAVMLDVSRNFQTKEQVIKILDLLALYKINVMHFHLNEDEAWRLEIPGLPELIEVGSKRGHTLDDANHLVPSYGSGPDVANITGTGYYSREDFVELLKYASERHIRIIPEIETPGHARAAIKSMDARYAKYISQGDTAAARQYLLRDLEDQSVYRSIQNWDDNIMNVALPSTYAFLEKVTDELIAMYKEADAPLQTIHFGGDEVPEGVWEKSPVAHQLIASSTAVPNVDELWHYFFNRINSMLKSRGLYLSGWEEIGMKKAVVNGQRRMVVEPRFANENFHADVWNNLGNNADLAYRLANAGYKVVLTNVTNFYFDLAYSHSFYEPGQYWGGYVDLDKPFRFVPYNHYRNQLDYATGKPVEAGRFAGMEQLTEKGKSNIVGLQAPLWAEIITTPERMEYLLLPKLFGLAERAWAKDPDWAIEPDAIKAQELYTTAWSSFVNTVAKRELPRLSHYAGGYHYRIPTAGIEQRNGKLHANAQFPGYTIRYTTDGSEPDVQSALYTEPINVSEVAAFRVFDTVDRGGRTVYWRVPNTK